MLAIKKLSPLTPRAATCIAAVYAILGLQPAVAQSTVPLPGAPRLEKLPVPASAGTSAVDIAAIARGFEAAGKTTGPTAREQATLLIFVSFSMPQASLARLAGQARKAGGVLLLNGLKDNSLPATAQAVYKTFGKDGAPLQIDPRAFSRYAITAVPAFILLPGQARDLPCAPDNCPDGGYAKAFGDVSADYALEQMARSQPAFKRQAQAILRRMEQ